MQQPVLVRGAHTTLINDKYHSDIYPDLGYSFCNCKNIFFTNWANIIQTVYDDSYEQKHSNELAKSYAKNFWKMHAPDLIGKTTGNKFLEIGAITPFLLDCAKADGFKTTALDIIKHDWYNEFHNNVLYEMELTKQHELLTENFETWDGKIFYDNFLDERKYDVIWASHIFEHFQFPLEALKKCYSLLNPNGILFVAMPDQFFIDWNGVYSWCHWHLREHHIFWDMDSFGDECINVGFRIINKKRNSITTLGVFGDYHILARKP